MNHQLPAKPPNIMPVQIRQLATSASDFEAEFAKLRHWSAEADHAIEERVAAILADVKARGDAAVLEYTTRFDGLDASTSPRSS
jgi:histidinol dehydrogenase